MNYSWNENKNYGSVLDLRVQVEICLQIRSSYSSKENTFPKVYLIL
jgi:hypothetical protein